MASSLSELTSPEYTAKLRKQAEESLTPSLGLQNQALDLNLQDLGQQETDIGREYDTLAETLRKQAETSTKSMEERQNQLGLLQSGMTAAGLGDIQSTLNKGIKESAQDKASRLASIALQRAGYGLKRAEIGQQYQSSVNDLVNQLLNRDIESYKLTHPSGGSGSSTYNPFAGLFDSLGGQTATATPSIGGKSIADLKGDVITNGKYVGFSTDRGVLTREQMTDILAGNPIVGMDVQDDTARKTQNWLNLYQQIKDTFPDGPETKQTPQITPNVKAVSPVAYLGGTTKTRKGF